MKKKSADIIDLALVPNLMRGDDASGPPMEDRLSMLIDKVSARLTATNARVFQLYDLDRFTARILVILLERDEMRVGELVDITALPQPTISHQLNRLEKRKLVRRRRATHDNRSVSVLLTPRGLVVARVVNQLSLDLFRKMTAEMSEAELAMASALLKRMFETLAPDAGGLDAKNPVSRAGDEA